MAALNSIITPAWLKERYLFGIDLTDDTGTAFPDSLFQISIDAAIDTLSAEFGIELSGLVTYTERKDIRDTDGESFFMLQLNQRPVREIVKLEAQYGSFPATEIPSSWLHIGSEKGGQIQVLAGPDALGSYIFAGNLPYIGLGGLYGRPITPLYFKVTYKAGFDGTEYPYPTVFQDAVGLMASMLPLDTAGDLIAGAGIASKSVSFDGLSTSLNTTSSATNSGYGARVLSYQKRLKDIMKNVRRDWRVPQIAII